MLTCLDHCETSAPSPVIDLTESDRVDLEKVAEIRLQLARGAYDIDGKLDAAMDAMLLDVCG